MPLATKQRGPLDGIRILDFTSVMMGPYCTQILADMGADVIKIESPEGDTSRAMPPKRAADAGGSFRSMNRGKRSVVIDLKRPEGRALCLDLVKTADVAVHSMRPQAVAKLGLDYAAFAAVNPGIICCNLLGFGRDGRYAGIAAYDDVIQAVSGLVMLQNELLGTPQYIPTVLADKVTGMTGAYAVLGALFHRQRTGEGQEVDVAMFETMASFVLLEHLGGRAYLPPLGPALYPRVVTPSRKPFRTRDGYLAVLVYNDKQWGRFAEIAGRPDLIDDPRFRTLADRSRNVELWNEVVGTVVATRTSDEWAAVLGEAGIPAIRLNTTDGLFDDPHLNDVGFFKTVIDEEDGDMLFPDTPVRYSQTPGGFDRAGPPLAAHTRTVLEEAGIAQARIDRLLADGVIKQRP